MTFLKICRRIGLLPLGRGLLPAINCPFRKKLAKLSLLATLIYLMSLGCLAQRVRSLDVYLGPALIYEVQVNQFEHDGVVAIGLPSVQAPTQYGTQLRQRIGQNWSLGAEVRYQGDYRFTYRVFDRDDNSGGMSGPVDKVMTVGGSAWSTSLLVSHHIPLGNNFRALFTAGLGTVFNFRRPSTEYDFNGRLQRTADFMNAMGNARHRVTVQATVASEFRYKRFFGRIALTPSLSQSITKGFSYAGEPQPFLNRQGAILLTLGYELIRF